MARIGLIFSDTGGGHRAAGAAIEAALKLRYSDSFEYEYFDGFRLCGFPPLHKAPEIYPWWVHHHQRSFDAFVKLMDWLGRHRGGRALVARVVGRKAPMARSMARWSLGVILHPGFTGFAVRVRRSLNLRVPLLTLVTDLAWPPSLWFHPGVDRCLVATPSAYDRGLKLGLKPEQIRVVGYPVHPKFVLLTKDKAEARAELGWEQMPTVLVVSGAEGMGGIEVLARWLDGLGGQLAIVTGRNAAAAARLRAVSWKDPAHIYSFVSNMEVLMRAADVLIGKPGPGIIAEAAISGLPMILTGGMVHELPNAQFVMNAGAGVYVRTPKEVRAILAKLLRNPEELERYQRNTRKIAYPDAPFDIAEEIVSLISKAV